MSTRPQLPARANPFFRTFVLSHVMRAVIDRELDDASGFGIYSAIGAMGRITPKDLAEMIGMPPTTLSGQIERLVQEGIVRRVDNPADGRSYLLELTEAGVAAHRAGGQGIRRAVDALAKHLDRPADDVLDALEALEEAARRALDDSTTS